MKPRLLLSVLLLFHFHGPLTFKRDSFGFELQKDVCRRTRGSGPACGDVGNSREKGGKGTRVDKCGPGQGKSCDPNLSVWFLSRRGSRWTTQAVGLGAFRRVCFMSSGCNNGSA